MTRPKRWLLVAAGLVFLAACRSLQRDSEPAISFSIIPVADAGGPESQELFQGRVVNAKPGQRVVLYAHSFGNWWLQPFVLHPFTEIKSDSTWQNSIHLGDRYAALLVDNSYKPSPKLPQLPAKGNGVLAIAEAPGTAYVPKILHFSGYDWEVRQLSSNRGGKLNPYDPANASVDKSGFLHLKLTHRDNQWFCADVGLKESLGQGLYLFKVRDLSQLDAAAVLRLYTWEHFSLFNRELGIHVSRWGNPASSNAEFSVQPSYQPNNMLRFEAPAGTLTFSFHWESGKVAFHAARDNAKTIAAHTFTSGVPPPGGETIHMSLYAYGNSHIPMKKAGEVVIESFQYIP